MRWINNIIKFFVSYDVFISYSDFDFGKAKEIHDHLSKYGIRVFLAKISIIQGSKWKEELKSNLNNANLFLFLISSASLKSFYAVSEAGHAWLSDKDIIPIKIERTAFTKEQLQWLSDFQISENIPQFLSQFRKKIYWVYVKRFIFWVALIIYLALKK